MKCQLIGYQGSEGVDRDTEKPFQALKLFFVRKPNLSESGCTGNVCFATTVRNEAIDQLPDLKIDSAYNVEVSYYKGFYKLLDMTT